MIRSINITNPDNAVVPWWKNASGLKGLTRMDFKPGLNAIYGPNGSGKSTLLMTIAKMLCCHQGGRQVVTGESLREIGHKAPFKDGVLPDHDGSPIIYFDPGAAVGLFGGMAAFDDDFFMEGVQNAVMKGSSGQTTAFRMQPVLGAILEGKWSSVEWKVAKDRHDWLAKLLEGTGHKECPTLLLDEPSRSLDLRSELGLWRVINKAVKDGVQVIVATHAVFPLNRPGVNFIETAPGYVKQTRRDLDYDYLLPEAVRLAKTPEKGSEPEPGA